MLVSSPSMDLKGEGGGGGERRYDKGKSIGEMTRVTRLRLAAENMLARYHCRFREIAATD